MAISDFESFKRRNLVKSRDTHEMKAEQVKQIQFPNSPHF